MSISRFLLFAAAVGSVHAASPTPFQCPASLTVVETSQPAQGWTADSPKTQHQFERISVFNGAIGGQEDDLAPDDQKKQGAGTVQTWNVANYRSMNVFLRCRYHDTAATLSADIPASVKTCSQTIQLDAAGKIKGKSEMSCR